MRPPASARWASGVGQRPCAGRRRHLKEDSMKRMGIELSGSALAFTVAMALSGGALAQEPALAPAPAPTPAPSPPPDAPASGQAQPGFAVGGSAQAGAGGGMTLPAAAPPPAAAIPGDSEHDQVVGTLAIGYLGTRSMVVGCSPGNEGTAPGVACGGAGGIGRQAINAPVIGVRYWISDLLGIDAGLGMAINGFSGSGPGGDINRPSSN